MKPKSTPVHERPGLPSIRTRLPHLLLGGTFLVATGAQSQAPSLVEDIHPGASSTASRVVGFESLLGVSGGRAYLRG